jgi:hypothetical protein
MAVEPARERSRWPLGLALALAAMIGVSLTLLGIASTHRDADVVVHPLAGTGAPPRPAH